MKIIRVFPRRTKATPVDDLVRVNVQPGMFDEADEVHISVAFTWDIPTAEKLAYQWQAVAPVKLGGPAFNQPSGDFIPGMYLKQGYTITSRGCQNRCWFCSVWRRENGIKKLPVMDGWNILDDNLLACSESHIRTVFSMLSRQNHQIEFTGGLEAKLLRLWHVDELRKLRIKQMFFAYDTPDDYEPLVEAGRLLLDGGYTVSSHVLRCYVLCGWPKDTIPAAEVRMIQAMKAGFTPMAMVYRDENGERGSDWVKWARLWSRPAIIYGKEIHNG